MKIFSAGFIIGVSLFVSMLQVQANDLSRGKNSDTGLMLDPQHLGNLLSTVTTLPFVGALFRSSLDNIAETLMSLDDLTDGMLKKILNGSLPCELSLNHGLRCRGASKKGGLDGMLRSALDAIPSSILPEFAKMLVLSSFRVTFLPMINQILSGPSKPLTGMK
ncbi:uncharacterized protein LOC106648302 [Trichogramma pretiosum]|uniref:uncharacterized protein LOC106648302 n=1 Tax=Trichogramma pretiosum TaxID=7493 RepID=UPI0006C94ED3|nr:uncharacterized protein LOC106648302 [Trichogramma pretiosum]